MSLFGEHGYESTSVGQIQRECGLAAGSGALYKHFGSKHEVLAEGIRRYVADLDKNRVDFTAALPRDPRAALQAISLATTESLHGDRDIVRVSLRDLEPYPDLLSELWDGVTTSVYQATTRWIAEHDHRAGSPTGPGVADPEATAAVLMGALTYFPILQALIDRTPGGVDQQRFMSAWVEIVLAVLGIEGNQALRSTKDD